MTVRGGSGAGSLGGAQQLTGGGGVVAEIFRDLQKPSRFSGGGGVVAEIFRITSPETDPIRSRERDTYTTHSLISRDIHESISQFGKTRTPTKK